MNGNKSQVTDAELALQLMRASIVLGTLGSVLREDRMTILEIKHLARACQTAALHFHNQPGEEKIEG